jgi:general secretion pathway protein H
VGVGRCSPRRGSASGFTLLELVLVLAIIAVILAVVAPTFSGFAAGRKPQDAAARFVALTHYARSQAIAEGRTYRIILDPAQGQWWLANDDSGMSPVAGPYGQMYAAADGVRMETNAPLENGQPTLRFESNGRCDPARVRFMGERSTVEVECLLPVDTFHVVDGGGQR